MWRCFNATFQDLIFWHSCKKQQQNVVQFIHWFAVGAFSCSRRCSLGFSAAHPSCHQAMAGYTLDKFSLSAHLIVHLPLTKKSNHCCSWPSAARSPQWLTACVLHRLFKHIWSSLVKKSIHSLIWCFQSNQFAHVVTCVVKSICNAIFYFYFLPDICLPKHSDRRHSRSAETECKSGGISNQKWSHYVFTANPTAAALQPNRVVQQGFSWI